MKSDILFSCTECGREMAKWMGRCPGCGEWNTVVEKEARRSKSAHSPALGIPQSVLSLVDIPDDLHARIRTGIEELDRVLGGGIVRKSLILLGGDPGIGKSTLLMQALGSLAARGESVLYVSGEESLEQLKMRANRLAVDSGTFLILAENDLEAILDRIGQVQATVMVVDSIQSVFSRMMDNQPGTVSQVRHSAGRILEWTKKGGCATFIVGHVTKDGVLAGPKLLEHMVDTVLYFEGERGHPYRVLRAVKNRFGSASEIGVFHMRDNGLAEVANPSELFLAERPEGVAGSVVTALVEGTRPILAEIQALVSGPVPGQGRRTCLGVDPQRLALVIAVIEKKLGITLNDQDIFVNAVGGVRATEPATDLALATALLSSFTDRIVPARTLVFGEIGLAGEIRGVSRTQDRIREGTRLGYNRIVSPGNRAQGMGPHPDDAQVVGVSHIKELGSSVFLRRG
ncbi:MAG: DNA repair protein RadA [Thermodesulfobacteriota bacterium]